MIVLFVTVATPLLVLYLLPRGGITSEWYKQYGCGKCGHKSKYSTEVSYPCVKCGSTRMDYSTRIVQDHWPNALFWIFGHRKTTKRL